MLKLRKLILRPPVSIMGAPPQFDLLAALRAADSITIASAFVHLSGWNLLRDSILASSARLTLITGLDFCQSEPNVMRDWIGDEMNKRKARAFLHVGPRTFHPKVFLIESRGVAFALIGSGNLSAGGLRDNVECFAYVQSRKAVTEIQEWIGSITSDRASCIPLTAPEIEKYEPKWKQAAKSRSRIRKLQHGATRNILNAHRSTMKQWMMAVSEAKQYFRSRDFHWYADQKQAAKHILSILKYPTFRFSQKAWYSFYDIWNMGHLVPINKKSVWDQTSRLQEGLRRLADTSRPVAERMDSLLDPTKSTYVKNLGINAVSKILASIDPQKWPVWNGPVETAVKAFGYEVPKGCTIGEKYSAFAELMNDFRVQTGAGDMLALDCFFCWKGKIMKDSNKASNLTGALRRASGR